MNETAQYIVSSKTLIDKLLTNNDYRNAFNMLIMVLSKLDNNDDKNEFIQYYNDYIFSKRIPSCCSLNNVNLLS